MRKLFNWLGFQYNKIFYPSNLKIEGFCSQCGVCCQKLYILIDYKPVISEKDFYRLQKENPSYRYLEILGTDDKGELYFKCNLLKDNKCSKYKQRPIICRKYPNVDMLKYGGILYDTCTYKLKPRKSFDYFLMNSMNKK